MPQRALSCKSEYFTTQRNAPCFERQEEWVIIRSELATAGLRPSENTVGTSPLPLWRFQNTNSARTKEADKALFCIKVFAPKLIRRKVTMAQTLTQKQPQTIKWTLLIGGVNLIFHSLSMGCLEKMSNFTFLFPALFKICRVKFLSSVISV